MNATRAAKIISTEFHKWIRSDPKILNAHLLVHSAKNSLHLNIAGGNSISGMGNAVHPDQPVYMASVGKLFTAVLISMLCEQGKLSFDDYIADFLNPELLNGLHVFRGKSIPARSS